jgi:hypothetical protein
MTVATRILFHSAAVASAFSLVISGSAVLAQPLVTGGLVVYYDFDSFTNTVMDGSGNNFNAKVQDATRNVLDQPFPLNTTGVISNDTSPGNFKRGGGAIRFTQSTIAGEDPVFIDMDGSVISATADGIGGTATDLPSETNQISMAAWVNATGYVGDFTVFNGASGGHGVPHFQIQGNGQIRFTIRDGGGQNTVDSGDAGGTSAGHPWPNQPAVNGGADPVAWPVNEWHHVAITYDYNGDWDGELSASTGHLDMFYDGVKILSQGNTGPGTVIGPWALRSFSDFYDGLAIGAVYDSGSRRTQGLMDEAYIFNRKLTDAEVLTLYNLGAPPTQEGDHNKDGNVDAADYVAGRKLPDLFGGDPAWYEAFEENFGEPGLGNSGGPVPEPASLSLLLICLGYFVGRRKR